MSCLFKIGGCHTDQQRNFVKGAGITVAVGAVALMTIGTLGLCGVIPMSTALWTHVGLLAGGGVVFGATMAVSSRIRSTCSKITIAISLSMLLSIPALFGCLGAIGVIPAYNMLYASTVMGGACVLAGPLIGTSIIGEECSKNKHAHHTAVLYIS